MATVNVVERLMGAYPRYSIEWETIKARTDFDSALPYSQLGELAVFLVDRIKDDDLEGIDVLFEEFESLVDERATRNLLIVGFLEDLQNVSLNRGVPIDRWTQWLGPKTSTAWKAVQDLWSGRMMPDRFNAFVDHQPSNGD